MPAVDKTHVLARLKESAKNSSHFTWMLSDLSFYETSNGFLFAYTVVNDVTLIALEPLFPKEMRSPSFAEMALSEFQQSWLEFNRLVPQKITAFIGVGASFVEFLKPMGFQVLSVGREPWIDLEDPFPKGNIGKGVRSARNQAIRKGAWVEEWAPEAILTDPEKKSAITEIFEEWRKSNLVLFEGFLLACDPFALSEYRRIFVARTASRVEAYLIATPISVDRSYYFEDLMQRKGAPKGVSELLMLEAIEALKRIKVREVSLGAVAMRDLAGYDGVKASRRIPFVSTMLQYAVNAFQGSRGMELHRKRFKPKHWSTVFVAAKLSEGSYLSWAVRWFRIVVALVLAYKPRVQFGGRGTYNFFTRPFKRYPVTLTWMTLLTLAFAFINKFGALPDDIHKKFGFMAEAPLREWFYRTYASDFLSEDSGHYFFLMGLMLITMPIVERRFGSKLTLIGMLVCCFFDDFLNYLLIVKPLQFFNTPIYKTLIASDEVGMSLVLFMLLGLVLTEYRRYRETLMITVSMFMTFGLVFVSPKYYVFIVQINHLLFFVGGYAFGRILSAIERAHSRQTSKGHAPQMNRGF